MLSLDFEIQVRQWKKKSWESQFLLSSLSTFDRLTGMGRWRVRLMPCAGFAVAGNRDWGGFRQAAGGGRGSGGSSGRAVRKVGQPQVRG